MKLAVCYGDMGLITSPFHLFSFFLASNTKLGCIVSRVSACVYLRRCVCGNVFVFFSYFLLLCYAIYAIILDNMGKWHKNSETYVHYLWPDNNIRQIGFHVIFLAILVQISFKFCLYFRVKRRND